MNITGNFNKLFLGNKCALNSVDEITKSGKYGLCLCGFLDGLFFIMLSFVHSFVCVSGRLELVK